MLQHEEASVKLFDHLVENNGLEGKFEEYGLNGKDLKFIKEQITGIEADSTIVKVLLIFNIFDFTEP